MALLRVDVLPDAPLAAAAAFHAQVLPQVLAALADGGDVTLLFPPADHTHHGWRLSAVQSLAREHAPSRINAVESDDESAIASTSTWLAEAPGVTGQYFRLVGTGAGPVL